MSFQSPPPPRKEDDYKVLQTQSSEGRWYLMNPLHPNISIYSLYTSYIPYQW